MPNPSFGFEICVRDKERRPNKWLLFFVVIIIIIIFILIIDWNLILQHALKFTSQKIPHCCCPFRREGYSASAHLKIFLLLLVWSRFKGPPRNVNFLRHERCLKEILSLQCRGLEALCLASQDALEVMSVTYSLTDWVIVRIDLTGVTLVSDDT